MGEMKVPVSLRAVVQRINRRLMKDDQVLKKARDGQTRQNFGDYYVINLRTNVLSQWFVNPVVLAQELNVLAAWEAVQEAE
jgi:hypothetical protein